MLGHGGIANAEEGGEFADRALAVDQLTDDHQAVTVRQRLEQIARAVGSGLHGLDHLFSYLRYIRLFEYMSSTRAGERSRISRPSSQEDVMAEVVVLGAGLGGTLMAYELLPQFRREDRLTVIGQGRALSLRAVESVGRGRLARAGGHRGRPRRRHAAQGHALLDAGRASAFIRRRTGSS